MRSAAARILLAVVIRTIVGALFASGVGAAVGAATTAIAAAEYRYDASTAARVDVREFGIAGAASSEVGAEREGSATPPSSAREASPTPLTPSLYFIATNSADDAARFAVDSAGNATLRARGPSGWVNVPEHAAKRMTQRGISIDALDTTLTQQPFQYWHEGVWKTGYYNPTTKVFAGTVNDTVTTVIGKASQNYINNLRAVTPP